MRAATGRPPARGVASSLWAVLCCVGVAGGYLFRTPQDLDVTPRITVPIAGLLGCRRFQSVAVNYGPLLLSADGARLHVGARGAAFSLNASDISHSSALTIEWDASAEQKQLCLSKGKDNKTECFNHIRFLQRYNSTHLYMCGTHAFRPLCTYIDEERFVMSPRTEEGRDKCPYSPATGYTGLIVDQQMYTASQYEFRSFPDIRRNSPTPALKTEDAPTRWLTEADFVGSALLRGSKASGSGDDDKIYWFFTERSQEQTPGATLTRVARVARVCRGDRGGRLTLQKRWTSFLKARLLCSLPEYDFHFNMLRSAFVLHGRTPADTLFYGVFGLEWKNVKASAVCRFSLPEVEQVFQGPYMESHNSGSKWQEYTGKVPEPRPGMCITDTLRSRGINFSTSLPDDVLDFVRRHPLMSQQVRPADRRPLLFRRTTDYTQMAVHAVRALDGHTYHVLFMGTDEGWLHRAVALEGQLHIVEELQLFEDAQPVTGLLISPTQMSVYVASPVGLVQLPLSTCHRYASCHECVFARDPYCGWSGAQCVDVTSHADRASLIQDVQHGNRGCENGTADEPAAQRSRSVVAGDDVLLQCELSSNLATPVWTLDGSELQGYGLDSGFRTGTDGLLLIGARPDQAGRYTCYALENSVKVAIVVYDVSVRLDAPGPPPPPPRPPQGDVDPTQGDVDPTQGHVDPTQGLGVSGGGPSSSPPQNATTTEPPLLATSSSSSERLPPPPWSPAPLLPRSEFLSPRNMEAMYLSLITILGGLCVVLTVVLLYVGFCLQAGHRGKYSLRAAAAAAYPADQQRRKHSRKKKAMHRSSSSSSNMELKTISNGSVCCNGASKQHDDDVQDRGGLLQIVPGEGHCTDASPPPAPPLPPPQQQQQQELLLLSTSSSPSECDSFFPNGLTTTTTGMATTRAPPCCSGLSATLPSVLRRMHGNSYVLLRQCDADVVSAGCEGGGGSPTDDGTTNGTANGVPLGHSFTDELNRILEKRKHVTTTTTTQLLLPRPDESSV